LESGGKRAVEVWHRRAGKDEVALHWTAVDAIQNPGNYWHMLPEYSHGRRALWDAVNPHTGKKRIDEAFPLEIRTKTNQQEMKIELVSGAIWHIVGSDNFDGLVGSPPRGVVFSEWSLADPRAWGFIEPILEENGGWAIFPYTPRGNNHGKTMYDHAKSHPAWFAELLSADKTGVFTADQLANIKAGLISIYGDNEGEALYNQEYHCSFEGCVPGAYYSKQMAAARQEGRITAVPHRSGVEVYTFWDLGVDDSMTIWFIQPIGKSFHVIDYYENTGFGLEHYAKALKGDLPDSGHRKAYTYADHAMPHDADQREMTSGEIALSRKEVAQNLGIKPIKVIQRAKNIETIINVHIPAVRNVLALCWFDDKRCSKGISALEGYCAEYDEVKKKLGNRPLHNWCSHGSDGFRTFAVGYKTPYQYAAPPSGQGSWMGR
jgi:phage terminase large subunit